MQVNIKENTKGNYHIFTLISSKYQTNEIKLESYQRPPQLYMKIYFFIFFNNMKIYLKYETPIRLGIIKYQLINLIVNN